MVGRCEHARRLATKKKNYLNDLSAYKIRSDGPWWGDVNMLAVYHVALDSADFGAKLGGAARKALLAAANELRAIGDTSAYRLPATPSSWNWGSNSAMANNGIVLLHAYYVTGDKSYLDGAQQCLDYLLGKNPIEMTYVTGFGYRSPRNPHHRVSESDFVDDPVPGMLARNFGSARTTLLQTSRHLLTSITVAAMRQTKWPSTGTLRLHISLAPCRLFT